MSAPLPARALLDGVLLPLEETRLAVTDGGVARGDGAFETVGVWDGRPFRMADHLARLAASLAAVGLPAPDLALLEAEARMLLDALGAADAALRFYVTGSGTRLLTLGPQPQRPPAVRLVPQPAPWIRPLGTYGPAGAKTMSYGPNMAAQRAAVRAGGDDALLVSLEGHVLEGPTFGVLWVSGDVVHAPARELGIVDSVSRRTLLDAARAAGLAVQEGRYALSDCTRAAEFLVCSAVRDVIAVQRLGDHVFGPVTPVRDLLAKALEEARRGG
jgi:branched-subunit amino acid aminotransferase/4-amino-4-deoxychorismate lyase